MDQFVSCHGRKSNAVMLDCRSLDCELVPIPDSVKFVICNTMVKHELSGGEYNVRRQQCEAGARILANAYRGIRALRDVSLEQLQAQASSMPEIIYKRCLHVVAENDRVIETARMLRAGNLKSVGKLMADSHASLRDLYEVSCAELDIMVEAAHGLLGFIGGRMTGGGFGGCTVNLVRAGEVESFRQTVARGYERATGRAPEIYVCSPAQGVGRVDGE